ncbi:hypothetical protein HGR_05566 [Hylemonella gracilis ATCC 19624]|uniref:Uncharacterized protein n=1 Tax=Hylemonella gracilis ATCC 19624 TaxID=887062 RepID=F3KRR5_9BURK|nr:hypothetical protein HGR_05566 [Hylemonella gracilis ATCC 19624]
MTVLVAPHRGLTVNVLLQLASGLVAMTLCLPVLPD